MKSCLKTKLADNQCNPCTVSAKSSSNKKSKDCEISAYGESMSSNAGPSAESSSSTIPDGQDDLKYKKREHDKTGNATLSGEASIVSA
jgi:hypothetical protein